MSSTLAPPLQTARVRWTTPQILWRSLWAVWACTVVLLLLMISAYRVHYSALTAIGKNSAPSIIASQQIKSALADMDANAANELLATPDSAAASVQAYKARREEAATALIAAAENITYGAAERTPILHIQLGLGSYEGFIQRARDLHQERNPAFSNAYNQAAELLDHQVLPAADALDQANLRELDAAYSGQHSRSLLSRTLVGAVALLLLALLLAAQRFLSRRTHRLINLPLLAATGLLFVFSALTFQALNSAERNLKRAKEDAFTSIHALWQARAIAYAANADESRFLLDPQHAAERTAAFYAKRDLLAKLPPGVTYDSAAQGSFTGYLADELNNITFPGEREAATETLSAFRRYVEIDGHIRNLESRGEHKQALDLCTGEAPGQSNWAFQQFDAALGRTLRINQDEFDAAVRGGFASLESFPVKASIFAAVLAILCLSGLLLRIREYR